MDSVDEEGQGDLDEVDGLETSDALGHGDRAKTRKLYEGYDEEDGESDGLVSDSSDIASPAYAGPFQRPDRWELWSMILSSSAVLIIAVAAILTTIYDWVL